MLELIFPDTCFSCGAPSGPTYICESCLEGLVLLRGSVCELCGRPFFDEQDEESHDVGDRGGEREVRPEACRLCQGCNSPSEPHGQSFSRARSVALYDGLLRDMLADFKFHYNLSSGEGLAVLFRERFPQGLNPEPDLVVPVPLHPRKLRERGFNQAVVLGRSLARGLGARLEPFVLFRKRYTRPQFELASMEERRENVRGAFSVESRPRRVEGARVLLVDDIFTSGCTVSECSRVLLDAGAKGVEVCTLTRSLGSGGDGGEGDGS